MVKCVVIADATMRREKASATAPHVTRRRVEKLGPWDSEVTKGFALSHKRASQGTKCNAALSGVFVLP